MSWTNLHPRTGTSVVQGLAIIVGMHLCVPPELAAQALRFPEISRRYDAVVLVADVASGRMLGGVRTDQAFLQQYHPGSLFKLAIAVAALQANVGAPSFRYTCAGADTIRGILQTCWLHSGHGAVGFVEALSNSCNLYFRNLVRMFPHEPVIQSARMLGMLTPSGFPGSSEPVTGIPGMNDTTILGESFNVSVAQMLRTALILASGGRLGGNGAMQLAAPRYRLIYEALRLCVRSGTAHEAWSRRYTLAGKTGTSPIPGMHNRTVGWFIGYAPFDRPRYAIAVICRSVRGKDAAQIARMVMEKMR